MGRPPTDSARRFIPEGATLTVLRETVAGCTACEIHKLGTQAIFGEGPSQAAVMMVGEQPGDAEDKAGHPFVGPAGRLLDKSLEQAGIDRARVYVTNVVKHFKFEPRGKRRIHQKPSATEIGACKPWLEEELRLVQPNVLVLLGATAAQAVLGKEFRLTQHRGEVLASPLAPRVLATAHPSSILRIPDDETRYRETDVFVADLKIVAGLIG